MDAAAARPGGAANRQADPRPGKGVPALGNRGDQHLRELGRDGSSGQAWHTSRLGCRYRLIAAAATRPAPPVQSWMRITASISTVICRGSDPMPTAERAWRPRSPRTATNRSEQPLITFD